MGCWLPTGRAGQCLATCIACSNTWRSHVDCNGHNLLVQLWSLMCYPQLWSCGVSSQWFTIHYYPVSCYINWNVVMIRDGFLKNNYRIVLRNVAMDKWSLCQVDKKKTMLDMQVLTSSLLPLPPWQLLSNCKMTFISSVLQHENIIPLLSFKAINKGTHNQSDVK